MSPAASSKPAGGEIAQTLDRGLRVLELLADVGDGLSPTDVANALAVHRSIAARLLATLLSRGYVSRRKDGRYVLGTTLVTLARHVANNLLEVAAPLLSETAEKFGLTVVLHVADDEDVVAMASVEPRDAVFHVGLRTGSRNPMIVGASGLAILAGRQAKKGERPEVTLARTRGYAITTGELFPNVTGVAAPIRINGSAEASVGLIVSPDQRSDFAELGEAVTELAARISRSFL